MAPVLRGIPDMHRGGSKIYIIFQRKIGSFAYMSLAENLILVFGQKISEN